MLTDKIDNYDIYNKDMFESQLGRYVFVSSDLEYGMFKSSKMQSMENPYIDPNSKNRIWALVYDIDRKGASMSWEDALMPQPNWTCQNPKNSHAHLGYALESPISRSIQSVQKPQRMLARIQHAMTIALKADRAYSHRLTKTPDHPRWRTFYGRKAPYDFDELKSYLPENLPLIKRREAVGEGRNVTLFSDLRIWAYRARLSYESYDKWESSCIKKAHSYNSEFYKPLPQSEVKATAKSVSKWVWNNFTGDKFSEIQRRRGDKSAFARQSKRFDLINTILCNETMRLTL